VTFYDLPIIIEASLGPTVKGRTWQQRTDGQTDVEAKTITEVIPRKLLSMKNIISLQ